MSEPTANLPAVAEGALDVYSPIGDDDREALRRAVDALEHTNLAARLARIIGQQLGSLTRLLPPGVSMVADRAASGAIRAAMNVALKTLARPPGRDTRLLHKAAAAASGAAGGLFGLTSLPVELPVSTIIILRSIAEIARREGEDLTDPGVALQCLSVFALGAHDKEQVAEAGVLDGGYFATRGLLAKTVSEASKHLASKGLGDTAAPVLVRLVSQIGSRFGLVVSEKLAAQAIPIVGAAGGAAVNYAFADHFQTLAFGHFTVRRLERVYGGDVVRREYTRLADARGMAA